MLTQIIGLHHVTSMASDARANNAFFTNTLGLRRVKKTVNFDAPDVYHLYYGDERGTPGTIMTYFPFPDIGPRKRGAGEVATTTFVVPKGALPFWAERFARAGIAGLQSGRRFGDDLLAFEGPDGDEFALVEAADTRTPWTGGGIPDEAAIRGFQGVHLRLRDPALTVELITLMGYAEIAREGDLTRYKRENGNSADLLDIETDPKTPPARPGAGSVHHIAFAVENREAQDEVCIALSEAGVQITPRIDRDYFWSIYFRSPGGVLFEIATNEPGFARDEDLAHLGEALKLPTQHAHLRERLERRLAPLE